MKKYIGWSCEFDKNTGEGQLARKFIRSNFGDIIFIFLYLKFDLIYFLANCPSPVFLLKSQLHPMYFFIKKVYFFLIILILKIKMHTLLILKFFFLSQI